MEKINKELESNFDIFNKLPFYELNDDFENCKGIYFLMVDNYVCYVGMSSTNIFNRIYGFMGQNGHIHKKIFNKFKILNLDHLDNYDILNLECYYIRLFNPTQNITHRTGFVGADLPEIYLKNSEEGLKIYRDIERNIAYKNAMKMAGFFNSIPTI